MILLKTISFAQLILKMQVVPAKIPHILMRYLIRRQIFFKIETVLRDSDLLGMFEGSHAWAANDASILEFRWSIKREKELPIMTVQPVELSLRGGSRSRSRALTMTATVASAAKTLQTGKSY